MTHAAYFSRSAENNQKSRPRTSYENQQEQNNNLQDNFEEYDED